MPLSDDFSLIYHSLDVSVTDYIAALHRLAEYCALGNMLDKILRDRLVCGINNSTMLEKMNQTLRKLSYGGSLNQAGTLRLKKLE